MAREITEALPEDRELMYGKFVTIRESNGYEQRHNIPSEKEMGEILEFLEVVEE